MGLIRNAPELGDRLVDRLQDIGEHRADDEIDVIALDEALDLGHRDVRLQFVVDDDHLRIRAAELAAERLDREVEAVADLAAEHRRGSGQGHDDADLHFFLSLRAAGLERKGGQRRKNGDASFHAANSRPGAEGEIGSAPHCLRGILPHIMWKST